MNKEYIKYKSKQSFLFFTAFIALVLLTTLFVGFITNDIGNAFLDTYRELQRYIVPILVLGTGIGFKEVVSKEFCDIYGGLPLSRKKYFYNLLAIVLVSISVPLVFYCITGALSVYNGKFELAMNIFAISYTFFSKIILAFFIIIITSFVITISGNSILSTVLFFLAFLYYQSQEYIGDSMAITKILPLFIVGLVLLEVSKILFEQRRVERIGKIFIFRSAEITFVGLCSSLIGILITIFIGNPFIFEILIPDNKVIYFSNSIYNRDIYGNIIALVVVVVVYLILDSLFIKNISMAKIKENSKNLIVPIVMYFGGLMILAATG